MGQGSRKDSRVPASGPPGVDQRELGQLGRHVLPQAVSWPQSGRSGTWTSSWRLPALQT